MTPDPEALSAELRARGDAVRRREVDRAFAALGGREALTVHQRQIIEEFAESIVDGALAAPERALADASDGRTVEAAARLPSDTVEGVARGADATWD